MKELPKEHVDQLQRTMVPVDGAPSTAESLNAANAAPAHQLLGPLEALPGEWQSLSGHGWNMIALPFADPNADPSAPPERRLDYRLLMNQYDETLKFDFIDAAVPNRGILRTTPAQEADQKTTALDYLQNITQLQAADFPVSGLPSDNGKGIHREPGLWLNMLNELSDQTDVPPDPVTGVFPKINIARLSTIPHGDSVLALGHSEVVPGVPVIPDLNGLPQGVPQDLNHPYLTPYLHFQNTPFFGNVPQGTPGFPGFAPVNPNTLLQVAQSTFASQVKKTTILHVDTAVDTGGISNIPFVTKQANATDMVSTFWIYELSECNPDGSSKFMMQYSQTVFLDFFPTADGTPGLIRWPHVSIDTLQKV